MRELTFWITPFTTFNSNLDGILRAITERTPVGWHSNVLLPTHFGKWPQAECNQDLGTLAVESPDDVMQIREYVESQGHGFGAWGVPHDMESPEVAASFAAVSGYYSANFEPETFWLPGDDPDAVNQWWERFWNALPDQSELDGNVSATVVPNQWGLGAFKDSLHNLAEGCNALALEVYGGLQTSGSYPSPNLWPQASFDLIRSYGLNANLIPILALDNLKSQLSLGSRLGHGNVHVWAL